MNSNNLEAIRRQIDEVDEKLTELIEKRMNLVRQVAEYKKSTGTEILDTSREDKVIQNVLGKVKNPEYADSIKHIFQNIMHCSKEYQRKKIEAYNKQAQHKKYGLIGEKLGHSLSPEIHNMFFGMMAISSTYDLIEIPLNKLPDVLNSLKAEGYAGINVTIPYKTEIMKYLDEVSSEAAQIGAVNTIKLYPKFKGYNTDYSGFGMALDYYGVKVKGKKAAVLGSGGSARAVVTYLADNGADTITIVSRNADGAKLKYPGYKAVNIAEFSAEGYDFVINCTPVGMYPKTDCSPLNKEQLKGAGFVMDLIYNPNTTKLMEYAEELGIPCANGFYMLIAQAICAQEIWQERTIDIKIINEIYKGLKDEV
ncbi:MAG: shikimate dehydrogenase [Clostridiaceae bacterium]|nr:shikimate dehydrogenase [Clostridiaceae bacterium]